MEPQRSKQYRKTRTKYDELILTKHDELSKSLDEKLADFSFLIGCTEEGGKPKRLQEASGSTMKEEHCSN